MSIAAAKVVGPVDGKAGFLGSTGVRFLIDGTEAAERFSLVEHPMAARALAAPLHRHNNEDEYSFVIEGRMGALLGDEHLEAGPGGGAGAPALRRRAVRPELTRARGLRPPWAEPPAVLFAPLWPCRSPQGEIASRTPRASEVHDERRHA